MSSFVGNWSNVVFLIFDFTLPKDTTIISERCMAVLQGGNISLLCQQIDVLSYEVLKVQDRKFSLGYFHAFMLQVW